jgi:subtilisin family serine protease
MKHFINLPLILILAVVFTSCATPYQIPQEIKDAQDRHIRTPREYSDPPIQLDPIEQIPDTTGPKGLRSLFVQNTGNWGYSFLEVDKYEKQIKELARRPVEVFIFDTGGAYDHPDLKPVTRGGKSFTGETLLDGNGHSTHCAGTYVGSPRGANDPIGIAYPLREKGLIHIRPYKVLSNGGSGSFTWINRGIEDANKVAKQLIDDGHFVIYSFSLGGGTSIVSSTDQLLKEAEQLGVLVSVAANGNNARNAISYPGKSSYTKGISSVNTDGSLSSFSNYGPETFNALPGSGILSTYKAGGYARLSGTSMATPHAGAIAAIVASIYDKATAKQIVAHIAKYSTEAGESGKDEKFGYGYPKIGEILKNPIGDDQPEQPDEEPDDEPAEPKPDPGFPSTQYEFTIPKTYSSLWRTMSDDQMKTLEFTVSLKYKVDKDLTGAAVKAGQIADGYFRNRFLMLPDGSTELNAAYWTKYFFKLIEGKKGNDIEVSKMTLNINGVLYEYNKVAPRKVNEDCPLRKGAITYQY